MHGLLTRFACYYAVHLSAPKHNLNMDVELSSPMHTAARENRGDNSPSDPFVFKHVDWQTCPSKKSGGLWVMLGLLPMEIPL